MLSERKASILQTIVTEYIGTATPVGSRRLAQTYDLGISSATIRSEMADLEEQGYITHPHTSAGRVPSDKGYRYYVESLMVERALSNDERVTIRHQFHQADRDFGEWTRLAAAILSQAAHNAAVVTVPEAPDTRLRRVDLVWLEEFLGLLIVVLENAQLRRQIMTFDEPVNQERLDQIAARINALVSGKPIHQIPVSSGVADEPLDPIELQVFDSLSRTIQAIGEQQYRDLYLDGLRHVFRQPEFANSEKMQEVLEAMEERRILRDLLPDMLAVEGVQVVIGQENRDDAMRECSVILTRYSAPGDAHGILGVLGPTRMPYRQTIPMVRYMGQVMSNLLGDDQS